MVTFEELGVKKPMLKVLTEMGFAQTTTIQEKSFSTILSGKDVIGIAQTGTGKTLAYLLPSLQQIDYKKDRLPQLLVIAPTRELVVQIVEEAKKLTTYMNLTVVGVFGGVNIKRQMAEIAEGLDILVATPGRLLDLTLSGCLKLKNVQKLVIDEVDEMLNLGFKPQVIRVLDLLPTKRQNILFSATMSDDVEVLLDLFFKNPTKVEASRTGTPLQNINQIGYLVPNFNTKINLLVQLLSTDLDMNKVLVFVSTKKQADLLHEKLANKFPDKIGVIHSNKDQNYRFNSVKQFQEGTYKVLIATDIIARGLDIVEVSHVVNFDTPDVPENYIHRMGRTGRADKNGDSLIFITEKEQPLVLNIEGLMQFMIPITPLPEGLVISQKLIHEEMPVIIMPNVPQKNFKQEERGASFHEKIDKNKKVNKKMRRCEEMKLKHKLPLTRGQKRK